MNCPVCKTSTLAAIALQPGLTGNQCPRCQGIWIASGQYFAWLKQHGPNLPEKPSDAPLPVEGAQQARLCPECGHLLRRYRILPDSTFSLDHCHQCNGMWFDRDEWATLETRNLHDDLNLVFTQGWQQKLRGEESHRQMEAIYQGKFSPQDYARIQEIRQWLTIHPQRAALLAFLQAEDPYKA